MEQWQPLSDIWTLYSQSLEEAIKAGYMTNDELSDQYIWPVDLKLAETEQGEIKAYVHTRMEEINEQIKKDNGLDPNVLANVIFRSMICGLLWQKERLG